MTELEVAWLAGLLEGEGAFLFPSPSHKYKAQVAICMQMTDEDVVAKAASLMQCSYRRWKNPKNLAWKPVYIVNLRGRKAVSIMEQILPYMGLRRTERISALLKSVVHLPRYIQDAKVTDELRDHIINEYRLGKSARGIARSLNLCHETVCRPLRRAGIVMSKGRRSVAEDHLRVG